MAAGTYGIGAVPKKKNETEERKMLTDYIHLFAILMLNMLYKFC